MRLPFLLVILLITLVGSAQTIALHPRNPHYFIYKGKPTVLITSAEHYGAVMNSDIDYVKYLDVLKKHKFNLTRAFVGSYCEGETLDFDPGEIHPWAENQNTLGIRPGKLLAPWARSDQPGYKNGGNKFDLDKWDENYFRRLKDFCTQAAARGIVVEIVFFSANYGTATWKNSPLYFGNNINLKDSVPYNEIFLPKHEALIKRQLDMVRKIVAELNVHDNVYYELCNEPYWLKGIPEVEPEIKTQQFPPEVEAWQQLIARAVVETESKLPKKHLIAQNFANVYLRIENPFDAVSVYNFHYAYPPRSVMDNYQFSKVVAYDETSRGSNAPEKRQEAWAFLLAGGAVYNNLDFSFATDDVTGLGRNAYGTRRSGKEVRDQLQVLIGEINSFDFVHSKPVDTLFAGKLPAHLRVYGLGLEGKDYLAYFTKDSTVNFRQASFVVPAGTYQLQWIDPLDGKTIGEQRLTASSSGLKADLPEFSDDLVVRIKSTGKKAK